MREREVNDYQVARSFLEETILPYFETIRQTEEATLSRAEFEALLLGYLTGSRYRRLRLSKLRDAVEALLFALEKAGMEQSPKFEVCARAHDAVKRLVGELPPDIRNPNEGEYLYY